jgi:hypothetical protein
MHVDRTCPERPQLPQVLLNSGISMSSFPDLLTPATAFVAVSCCCAAAAGADTTGAGGDVVVADGAANSSLEIARLIAPSSAGGTGT